MWRPARGSSTASWQKPCYAALTFLNPAILQLKAYALLELVTRCHNRSISTWEDSQ